MDYSQMSTLLSCARKYEHLYIDRVGDETGAAATNFGTLWHRIMELHSRGYEDPVTQALDDLKWTDDPTDYRTADKARLAYQRWREKYIEYPWLIHASEEPFSVMLPGIMDEPYEGRMDTIVEADAGEGMGLELWVGDYKTTSSLLSDWVSLYRISNQFKLYYVVAKMCHPHKKIAGVVVDVLHVLKGTKSGKTDPEREGIRLYRVFFRYDEAQCREALNDFDLAVKVKKFYQEQNYFPRNTKTCRDFNKACPFLDVCDTADPDLRRRILAVLPPNTFNPLDRSV